MADLTAVIEMQKGTIEALQRQVETLREDAEVGRSIVKLFSEGHSIFSEHGTPKIVKSGWWKEVRLEDAKLLIIEALREAAKTGEVEG